MYNKYEIRYCREVIQRFYASLKFTGFSRLTEERRDLINELVERNRNYFAMDTTGFPSLVTSTAKKLHKTPELYGVENDDEKVYFYIRMLDPDFKYLEIYESFYNKETIKEASLLNFSYYDNLIIYFEKVYNKRFKIFEPDELWTRESIKRVRLKPSATKKD